MLDRCKSNGKWNPFEFLHFTYKGKIVSWTFDCITVTDGHNRMRDGVQVSMMRVKKTYTFKTKSSRVHWVGGILGVNGAEALSIRVIIYWDLIDFCTKKTLTLLRDMAGFCKGVSLGSIWMTAYSSTVYHFSRWAYNFIRGVSVCIQVNESWTVPAEKVITRYKAVCALGLKRSCAETFRGQILKFKNSQWIRLLEHQIQCKLRFITIHILSKLVPNFPWLQFFVYLKHCGKLFNH